MKERRQALAKKTAHLEAREPYGNGWQTSANLQELLPVASSGASPSKLTATGSVFRAGPAFNLMPLAS